MKRFEKVQEIRKYLGVARGQLDLIENSFRLLADQIVTMQSPQQLSGQLDELLDGVQAIKDSTADTERMLNSLGLAIQRLTRPMNEPRLLPSWAEDLRRRYLRGEASMFVLHGNVYDVVVHGQKTSSLVDFLTDVLLKDTRETHRGLQHGHRAALRQARGRAPATSTTCSARRTRTRCCRPSSGCSWARCARP